MDKNIITILKISAIITLIFMALCFVYAINNIVGIFCGIFLGIFGILLFVYKMPAIDDFIDEWWD